MSKLTGKVAVVTGASKGIGAGIAKGLADAGAAVVVNYASSKDGADRVVAEISKGAAGRSRFRAIIESERCAAALCRNGEGFRIVGCAGE